MENILYYALKIVYLLLPGIFANMAPVLVKNVFKSLAIPVDCNKTFRGKRVLGDHKTVRGFLFGILFSIIIAWIQTILYDFSFFRTISILPYSSSNFALLGFLMGFGALFGDSVKSFFKRRLNVEPGKPFFPWDQLDAPLGGIIFVSFVYQLSFSLIIGVIVVSLILHLLIRTIGYYTGLNKERW